MNHVRYGKAVCSRAQLTLARGGATFTFYRPGRFVRADYFLRKRSSRTTSAPLARLCRLRPLSSVSRRGSRHGRRSRDSRQVLPPVSRPRHRPARTCRPNCTDGSKKLLMELNGTTSRSGIPAERQPDLKTILGHHQGPRTDAGGSRSSLSGYCASSRGEKLHALGGGQEGDEEMMLPRAGRARRRRSARGAAPPRSASRASTSYRI